MKVDLLKNLIKEAVREVLKEELSEILSEDIQPAKPKIQKPVKYESYKPPVQKARVSTGDPIMDLLEETKASMIGGGNTGYYQDISQYVSAPGLGENTYNPVMMEENFSRPEPGLDISQFDFVKNAAAIFKASQQKDKERLG
jgi:hypothetical protein